MAFQYGNCRYGMAFQYGATIFLLNLHYFNFVDITITFSSYVTIIKRKVQTGRKKKILNIYVANKGNGFI